jgi:pimeloyl-ACP methyl ester carboxylesterase
MDSSQSLELESGRLLGYAEYGVEGGFSVFYFHGYPGSRLEAALMEDQWAQYGVHVISVDRPGLGLSDYQVDRVILDHAEDVLELAAHLELGRFGVLGVSGGGPYALACAYKIPSDQLSGCAVVSGSGPYYLTQEGMGRGERNMLFIARNMPWAFRFLLWLQLGRNVGRDAWWESGYAGLVAGAPEPDGRILSDPRVKENIKAKTVEAFRQGSKGLVHDFRLYSEHWGFELSEIPAETRVSLFHGELDRNVPVSIARTVSELIPHCEARFFPDEGHMSAYMNRFEEITNSLKG